MVRLSIYASVEEHDEKQRQRLLGELKNLGITPIVHNDYVEFRYYGEAETVRELAELCYESQAHSVAVRAGM